MGRIKLILLLAVLGCAATAHGDFYPIQSIAQSSGISVARPGWEEHLGERGETRFEPLAIENVAVKSQDLRITFRSPDTIEVESDYVLTTYEKNVSVEVQYFYWTCDYHFDKGMHHLPRFEDFEVRLNGKIIDPDKLTYFLIDAEPGYPSDYSVVFPLEFRNTGNYKITISYLQKVPDGFAAVRDAALKSGSRYGFSYDINPLQYWAGGVGEIRVVLILDGLDILDFGLIAPSDFVFTENGCKWEWHDLSDDMFNYLKIDLYYGRAGSLGGDFTEVLCEGGMEVYNHPVPNSKVIRTLEQGERVYLYWERDDPVYGDGAYTRGWRKCRLLDNTEGFVITWLPEYFFDSWERRKISDDFKWFYGEGP